MSTHISDRKIAFAQPKVSFSSSAKKKKSVGKLGAQRLDLDDLENEMCVIRTSQIRSRATAMLERAHLLGGYSFSQLYVMMAHVKPLQLS